MSEILEQIIAKKDLTSKEMTHVMQGIVEGEFSNNYVAGLLIALRMKGESVDELVGAANFLRAKSTKLDLDMFDLVDTCGTGGDGLHTFNISTTSSFVAAAAGVKIAKHGGRSVSSASGSIDVLESLGINVNIDAAKLRKLISTVGIGFMFAANFHPAMKVVAPIRKDLGVRTIFNLLGPLINPANVKKQIVGVFHKNFTAKLAEALLKLNSHSAMVVHSRDGMDEISMNDITYVAELKQGKILEYEIDPKKYNLHAEGNKSIIANSIEESKKILLSVLNNENTDAKKIVILNAAATIYISGLANSYEDGINIATLMIENQKALALLDDLVRASHE